MIAPAFEPLQLRNGETWANRFALAPLTNKQSGADGVLSEAEKTWLEARAKGGFGMVMTAAAHVQAAGQGFSGQLGVFDDIHLPGLRDLADRLRAAGACSSVQLQHAGGRAVAAETGLQPVAPSEGKGARALSEAEVEGVRDDFIKAALRSRQAGFDGVEVHGAHGYLLTQFLSPIQNQRSDKWGGSYENRTRLIREIVTGIRKECGPRFTLGLRISPERYGISLDEARRFAGEMLLGGELEYLDVSLWDYAKLPEEPGYAARRLIDWFTDLPRGDCALGVAGKIYSGKDVDACFAAGVDFILPGRAAIVHADFPRRLQADRAFSMLALPVSRDHLRSQALSETFIDYMASWPDFVAA